MLNSKEHGFYRYTPAKDLYFAKNINLIPVTVSEVKKLCCEYPIVIVMEEETPRLVLLSGLKENMAIDEKGVWKGTYVPSFLKRYPFTLMRSESDDTTAHIGFDLESGLFSSPEGEPLFNPDGTPSEILENINTFLAAFQKENQLTTNILLRLKEEGLIEAAQLTYTDENGEEQKVGGFAIISKEKLFETDDAFLLEAVRNGWMEMIELHNLSLAKIKV